MGKESIVLLFALFVFVRAMAVSDTIASPTKRIVLPSAYYMPETRVGAGVFVSCFFNLNPQDSLTRKSNTQSFASVTLNKQFLFENEWRVFSKRERFIFSGSLDYTRFPELFFGVGNTTKHEDKELYSFDLFKVGFKNVKKIGPSTYVGIYNELSNMFRVLTSSSSMMMKEGVVGRYGFFTNSVGPLLLIDKRDNVLNSRKGIYVECYHILNGKYTLSPFKYNQTRIDVRFFKTMSSVTLGIQMLGVTTKGEVPFRLMPYLGGAGYLRGFYRGRFRDHSLLLLQSEIRVPIYKRFGTTVFGGVGQVSKNLTSLDIYSFKSSFGAGIRYMIDKKERANLRLDIGVTNEGYGTYIVFSEAF